MKRWNKFHESLKTRRKSLGLTQRSFAQKLGAEASDVPLTIVRTGAIS